MRPFLFLGTRAEDEAADGEYDAVLRYAGLDEARLERRRLERDPLGEVDLAAYSGIILGGGPFNVSDPAETKSATQLRVEAELNHLARRVVDADFPFLGACYGIGTLGVLDGGVVDRTYGEPVSAVTITLTDEGRRDPVFGAAAESFQAFLGHKEAVATLPTGAILLATGEACPVQGFRIGHHVYATQFHPELDSASLQTRIDAYREFGYFPPEEAESLKAVAREREAPVPAEILRRFVLKYSQS